MCFVINGGSQKMWGVVTSVAAGLCAAMASVTAKLALEGETAQHICKVLGQYHTMTGPQLCQYVCINS